MLRLPAVTAEGEPPVAFVKTATRFLVAVAVAFVRIGTVEVIGMMACVRTEVDEINALVVVVVPTTTVSAVVPAKAVVIFTNALSISHEAGSAPSVTVTVSAVPVAPVWATTV